MLALLIPTAGAAVIVTRALPCLAYSYCRELVVLLYYVSRNYVHVRCSSRYSLSRYNSLPNTSTPSAYLTPPPPPYRPGHPASAVHGNLSQVLRVTVLGLPRQGHGLRLPGPMSRVRAALPLLPHHVTAAAAPCSIYSPRLLPLLY